ncbi:MAG: hypothetical protein PHX86_07765 [Caldisericia bacterium]|nr:hypothetical protein [Caldisericia bacterium]
MKRKMGNRICSPIHALPEHTKNPSLDDLQNMDLTKEILKIIDQKKDTSTKKRQKFLVTKVYDERLKGNRLQIRTPIPRRPIARDEMDSATFDAMMQRGLDEAKAGIVRPASTIFSELKQKMK